MTSANAHRLRLRVLAGRFSVCRLAATDEIPAWARGDELLSITRTRDELSIVCAEDLVPDGVRREAGYAAMKVAGPLAPELVGILVSIATPLASAGIPILAIGTFDTDYVMVRSADLSRAVEALRAAGHEAQS